MDGNLLQNKIDLLQTSARTLCHVDGNVGYVYQDDLSLLNKQIHKQINELYACHGKSVEQEASLCLALLIGYSVSMYANISDDSKRQNVLNRSWKILEELPDSPLKQELLAVCNEYADL